MNELYFHKHIKEATMSGKNTDPYKDLYQTPHQTPRSADNYFRETAYTQKRDDAQREAHKTLMEQARSQGSQSNKK